MLHSFLATTALVASLASAHTGAWAPGMYCRGGADPTKDDQNTNLVVNPLYMLSKQDWWFQHDRGCDKVPPPAGEFLEVPANGEFTVELAHNRAFTSLSYDGRLATAWPDGKEHPEDWNGWTGDGEGCLPDDGALHVQNETSATGTAFAISYQSDLSKVTMENLAVFSVAEHTPWKRLATYQVPDLPACPPEGCTCAWLWVPKGCGQWNIYIQGFKCMVTGATSTTPVAPAQPPLYCKDNPASCVSGAKQMIVWQQAEGNNVVMPQGVPPGYNLGMGWRSGAQTDIFEPNTVPPPAPISSASPVSTSSSAAAASAAAQISNTPLAVISASTLRTIASLGSSSSTATLPVNSLVPSPRGPGCHLRRRRALPFH